MNVEKINDHIAKKRGRLKIFLGAVAGVGKTYRMLSEAHRRLDRGEDIVVGLVEPHGRPATTKLLEGLELIPLKCIEYKGKIFYELDTAAVIKRNPEYVIIDELAHTNVPGTNYEKRWQSVDEILDAGINILTTLNIQHIESLNDAVYEITGVRVRETIPDVIVDNADEIELEDLTPDALINRLKRGDIYHGEKIPQALANFFKKENIAALREISLRRTAEEVDDQLHKYIEGHKTGISKTPGVNIAVCVAPRPLSLKLVRRGYSIAQRMQGNFSSVYVRTPGATLSRNEEIIIQEIFDLTHNLGGKVVELQGESVSEEIIKFVKESGATFIVMGQSARSRWREIFKGSTINRIMRETKNIDIVIVADSKEESSHS